MASRILQERSSFLSISMAEERSLRNLERESDWEKNLRANFKPVKLEISRTPSEVSLETALFWRTLENVESVSPVPFSGVEKCKELAESSASSMSDLHSISMESTSAFLSTPPSSSISGPFIPEMGLVEVESKKAIALEEMLDYCFLYLQRRCLDVLEKYSTTNDKNENERAFYVLRRDCLAKIGRAVSLKEAKRFKDRKRGQPPSEDSALRARARSLEWVIPIVVSIPNPESCFLPPELARKLLKFGQVINGVAAWFRIQTPWQYRKLYLFADLLQRGDPVNDRLKLLENSLPQDEISRSEVFQLRSSLPGKEKRLISEIDDELSSAHFQGTKRIKLQK